MPRMLSVVGSTLVLGMVGIHTAMAKGPVLEGQCQAFDLSGDGEVGFEELTLMMGYFESDADLAQWLERGRANGCLHPILSDSTAQIMIDHFRFCDVLDVDGNAALDTRDFSSVLGSANFTVPQKLDALTLISGDKLHYETSSSGSLNLLCVGPVDPGWLAFTGVVDTLRNDLETCFDADLNEDGELDIADMAWVGSPRVELTIEERIQYSDAIQSAECSGGLE